MKQRYPVVAIFAILALILSACAATPASPLASAGPLDVTRLAPTVNVATVKALLGRSDVVILDVREQSEYDAGHNPGVKLLPKGAVASRLNEIPKDKPVIVTCRSGNRSGQVTEYLRSQGYTNVHNMQGGLAAWQNAGYPVEK